MTNQFGFALKATLSQNIRLRNAVAGSGAMVGGRILGMVANFLMLGMITRYFSREEFGLYAVLTSFMALSGSLDFGVSNGLRNKLAAWAGDASKDQTARQYFFSTLYTLLFLVVLVGILLTTLSPIIPWTSVFNIADLRLATQGVCWLAVIANLILLLIPLQLYSAGFFAYQSSFWNAPFDALPKLGALIFVSLAIALRAPFYVVTSVFFGSFTLSGLAGLIVFQRSRGWRLVQIGRNELVACIRDLAGLGLQFWLLSMLSAIGMYSNTYITSQVLGLDAAGDFNVVQRLFFLLIGFHLSIITPFWSAFTDAQAAGDWPWARSAMRRLAWASVALMTGGCLVMVAFYRPLLWIWTGKQIDNTGLVVMMAIWTIMYVWNSTYSIVLNGFGLLRGQLVLGVLTNILVVPISICLGRQMGVVGIMVAFVFLSVPATILYPLMCRAAIDQKLTT